MSDETQRIDVTGIEATKRNLNAGKKVFDSHFELQRELGSGGMGVVWLARDLWVDGRVALKFLPGLVRDPVAERDLRDEVKNARDLSHENIVSVRALHKDEATIAVEMEYVDGPNVNMLIANSPNRFLEIEEAAPIVRGLCMAIDYAWAAPRRLVHRDIKPHNLLVNSAGQVKVVDFGIAHTVSETITRLTGRAGDERERVVGTLPYMSPQQLKGEVHHSNDVYSIGATIYQMLAGVPPFRATDTAVLMRQIDADRPPSMTERRRQVAAETRRDIRGAKTIPRAWEETVAACLAKNPAKRPASAHEIAVRLGLVAGAQPRRWPKALVAAGIAVVVAGGAAWTLRDRLGWPSSGGVDTLPAADAKVAAQPAPAAKEVEPPAPVAAPVRPATRTGWSLGVAEPGALSISTLPDNRVLFQGTMNAGESQNLPVDVTCLIQAKDAAAVKLMVDGQPVVLPDVSSHRWLVAVPSDAARSISIKEAPPPPPPFEKEVGPLVAAGTVNKLESDWLRAALGGDKGEPEAALARALFAESSPITLNQWRARTTLKFKPDPAALTAANPEQKAHAIDVVLPPGGAEMRLIWMEPGRFQRGSPADEVGRRPSDPSVTQATVEKGFFVGIFEVTQAQYESVMKRNPSYWRGNPTWPVDQVTWSDLMGSMGFLTRLNAALAVQYNGLLVADLPTDEEWEYACRAGTTTSFNNGENITNIETDPALRNLAYYNRAGGGPRPVGAFNPNAWGLYDMHGNLQEWTRDGYVRGGSWESKAAGLRAAARIRISREASASNQTGFRLVLRLRAALP